VKNNCQGFLSCREWVLGIGTVSLITPEGFEYCVYFYGSVNVKDERVVMFDFEKNP